jgi:alpha-glucosidase
MQVPGVTTTASRKNDFELLVALDAAETATGDLFADDGESLPVQSDAFSYIHFSLSRTGTTYVLSASGIFNYQNAARLGKVYVLGMKRAPKVVIVEDIELSSDKWSYDSLKEELTLRQLNLPLKARFTITMES